jgi:hypothetical protein
MIEVVHNNVADISIILLSGFLHPEEELAVIMFETQQIHSA